MLNDKTEVTFVNDKTVVVFSKERVYALKKEKGLTNRDIGIMAGYGTRKGCEGLNVDKEIDKIMSKKPHQMPLYRLKRLADGLGCRVNYLRELDNDKTPEEYNKSLLQGNIDKYSRTIDYLNSIGIKIELNPYMLTSPASIVSHFDELKCLFYDEKEVREAVKGLDPNGSYLTCLYRLKSGLSFVDKVELEDNLQGEVVTININLDNVISNQTKRKVSPYEGVYMDFEDFYLQLLYEIKIDNKIINRVPISKMNDFLITLDNVCKTATASLLATDTFSNPLLGEMA